MGTSSAGRRARPPRAWWLALGGTLLAAVLVAVLPEVARPWGWWLGMGVLQPALLAVLGVRVVALLVASRDAPLRRVPPPADPPPAEGTPWDPLPLLLLGGMGILLALGYHRTGASGVPHGSDATTFLLDVAALLTGRLDLYHPDKLPLYPWLGAWGARLVGGDVVRGAQAVSAVAVALVPPLLYLALRHPLGRGAALAGALLYAVAPGTLLLATETTSYPLFTLLAVGLAGMAGLAGRSRRLLAWAGVGVLLGLALLTEVKALSLLPALGLVLVPGLFRRRTPWRIRLGGPLLVALFALAAQAVLDAWPVEFTTLDRKLDVQRHEVVRMMVPGQEATPMHDGGPAVMPPLARRLQHNVRNAGVALGGGALSLVLLAGAALAGSVVRPRRAGPWWVAAWLTSLAGAFTLLMMRKYLEHALPFFLGLAAAGAGVLATALAPRDPARWVRPLLLALPVAGLALLACGVDDLRGLARGDLGRWGEPVDEARVRRAQAARALVDRLATDASGPVGFCGAEDALALMAADPAGHRRLGPDSGRCQGGAPIPLRICGPEAGPLAPSSSRGGVRGDGEFFWTCRGGEARE